MSHHPPSPLVRHGTERRAPTDLQLCECPAEEAADGPVAGQWSECSDQPISADHWSELSSLPSFLFLPFVRICTLTRVRSRAANATRTIRPSSFRGSSERNCSMNRSDIDMIQIYPTHADRNLYDHHQTPLIHPILISSNARVVIRCRIDLFWCDLI